MDDLPLCAAAKSVEELQVRINYALMNVKESTKKNRLEITANKNEVIRPAGRKM